MSRMWSNIINCMRTACQSLNLQTRIPRLATVEEALRTFPKKKSLYMVETTTIESEHQQTVAKIPSAKVKIDSKNKREFSTHQRLNAYS